MPTYEKGDMWSAWGHSDLFLITTNSTITNHGKLVMGRGIALEAKNRFQGLDEALGKAILSRCNNKGEYHLLVSPRWPKSRLGCFQVKRFYAEDAMLPIIKASTHALVEWCRVHPDARVDLNFPGIGAGRLTVEQVKPIIDKLPDQVHVWQFK